MIFETHAHYEDKKFDTDREQILSAAYQQGITAIVNVASTIETTRKSIELSEKYNHVYASVGVHPSEISDLNEESMEWIQKQAGHRKVLAVGEIGLDYYWEKDEDVRERQRYWFKRQLQIAKETGLPVIIHSRDAAEDTLSIMKQAYAMQISGVIHCFSYSAGLAEEYVQMGYYIGVGGVITFKNAKKLKEAVARIPLNRILLETDCPYMAPEPYRGKRNSSLYLPYIVKKIAEIKDVPEQKVMEVTYQNACTMYRVSL